MASWQCRERLSARAGRALTDDEAAVELLNVNKSAVCPVSENVPRSEYLRREREARRRMTVLSKAE